MLRPRCRRKCRGDNGLPSIACASKVSERKHANFATTHKNFLVVNSKSILRTRGSQELEEWSTLHSLLSVFAMGSVDLRPEPSLLLLPMRLRLLILPC